MTKRFSALLLTATLALTACGSGTAPGPVAQPNPTTPTTPARSAAVFELTMNGVGRAAQGLTSSVTRPGLSAQAGEINGLTFTAKTMSSVADLQSGVLHLVATYTVTNTTGAALAVPTFVPVDTSGAVATDGETPFRNVVTRQGVPISPDRISLERARVLSNGAVVEDPSASTFVTNLDTGALGLTLPAGTDAPGISHQGWQTGSLPAGGSVDVNFAMSVKLQGSDVGDNDPFRFSLLFAVADNPGTAALTNVASVQGSTPSGDALSPLNGQSVTVEGVVTATYNASLQGFFVQEEGIDADSDATTSNGVFVYCGASGCPAVTTGDRVRVTGTVTEFRPTGAAETVTQLSTAAASVTTLVSGVPQPTAQTLTLPLNVTARERSEGMRVRVSGTVTNNFPLGRFGSFDIADVRVPNFTQLNAPDAGAYATYQADFKNRFIRIDDGNRQQNPDPELFARSGQNLSAANTLRGGDSVSATGVLTYSNDSGTLTSGGSLYTHRILASQADVQVTDTNPRLATPENVLVTAPSAGQSQLRVGSMNVLNYFTTLVTANEGCTPNGTDSVNSRGANNCEEFGRQQTKIVKAITGLNPDVLGILEMQNDFDKGANSSIANLVAALNAEAGAGTFAYVNPGAKVGGDAISVAMIYKPGSVDPVGNLAILDNTVVPTYTDTCNRPTWAQTFQSKANGGRFTAVMMHLKSKGSVCAATNDADTGDGQGNGFIARRNAANAIVNWLGTNPTGVTEDDRILMGDYNAYASEEPLSILATGGYANVFDKNVYSYQFDGQWGSLDQATASSSMISQIAGHTKWHINADEPTVLDYNKEFKSAGQISGYYSADPFRSSDHDPILIGLNLNAQAPITPPAQTTSISLAAQNATVTAGQTGTTTVTVNRTNYSGAVTLAVDSVTGTGTAPTVTVTTQPGTGTSGTLTVDAAGATAGTYTVTVRGTGTGVSDATTTFTVTVSGGTSGGAGHVVVNEVQTAGAGGASDEFVELFNPTASSVDLGACSVVYRSAAGTIDTTLAALTGRTIAAGKYLLLGGSAYTGTATKDVSFTAGLSATGGGVALKCSGTVIDSVGFGTATNAFVEGTVAAAPTSGQSIARTNGADTNNNSADFRTGASTPQNSAN